MKTMTIHGGVRLSEISLGYGRLGKGPDSQAFAVMDRYAEMGGATFDTARLYAGGMTDVSLGRWIKSRCCRGRVTVVTKGSHPDPSSMFVSRLSRAEIEGDLDLSLAAIGTDYSDLHMLHRDDVTIPVGEIVLSLDALVRSGKARAVGVSNWTATRIIQANRFARENSLTPIACSQLLFGLGLTTHQTIGDLTCVTMNETEAGWYRESGLPVLAFGAAARGWFAALDRGDEPKALSDKNYTLLPENLRRAARLSALARELGRSVSAVAVAYVRDSGLNASPLCAFSTVAQLEDSLDALNFVLTAEQVGFLEGK